MEPPPPIHPAFSLTSGLLSALAFQGPVLALNCAMMVRPLVVGWGCLMVPFSPALAYRLDLQLGLVSALPPVLLAWCCRLVFTL